MSNRESSAEVELGAVVLAHWEPADAYFVGTVVEERSGGLLQVVFEDGDVAVIDRARVKPNRLKPHSQVFARWRDGRYYPGRIERIVGRALKIDYDDGDGRWVPWSAIAVKVAGSSGTTPKPDAGSAAPSKQGDAASRTRSAS